jgi:hypothetical protein
MRYSKRIAKLNVQHMPDPETIELLAKMPRVRRIKMAYNKTGSGLKIPAIRFSGKYLESLGFDTEGEFDLTINEDKSITIRPVPNASSNKAE